MNIILSLVFASRSFGALGDDKHGLLRQRSWLSGINFEIEHHSKWLCGEKCGFDSVGWFAYEKTAKLAGRPIEPHRKHLCEVIGAHMKRPVRLMLDHGAGPFTNLGKRFTCPEYMHSGYVPVDALVVAVDPLANLYHELLNNHSVFDTLRTQKCASEQLSRCLGREVVDVSIIINALDHSNNPAKAWQEVVKVTAPGGIACVYGNRDEARSMGGKGFHQWNFNLNARGEWIIAGVSDSSKVVNIDVTFKDYMHRVLVPATDIPESQFMACYQKHTSA